MSSIFIFCSVQVYLSSVSLTTGFSSGIAENQSSKPWPTSSPRFRKSKSRKDTKVPQIARDHYSKETDGLPTSPDTVAESSAAPSVPQETSAYYPSVFDSLSLFDTSLPPPAPGRHSRGRHSSSSSSRGRRSSSSSSSDSYGRSYRSRSESPTAASFFGGPDPSFPYPTHYDSCDSLHKKLDEPPPLERQRAMPELYHPTDYLKSAGFSWRPTAFPVDEPRLPPLPANPWGSISSPIPELDRRTDHQKSINRPSIYGRPMAFPVDYDDFFSHPFLDGIEV